MLTHTPIAIPVPSREKKLTLEKGIACFATDVSEKDIGENDEPIAHPKLMEKKSWRTIIHQDPSSATERRREGKGTYTLVRR